MKVLDKVLLHRMNIAQLKCCDLLCTVKFFILEFL
jgi:hypothetical protein